MAYDEGIQVWAAAWGSSGARSGYTQIWYSDQVVNRKDRLTGPLAPFRKADPDEQSHAKRVNDRSRRVVRPRR